MKLAEAKISLIEKTRELAALREKMAAMPTRAHADEIVNSAVPLMKEIRKTADSIEIFLSGENMPYPNYRNLLSHFRPSADPPQMAPQPIRPGGHFY